MRRLPWLSKPQKSQTDHGKAVRKIRDSRRWRDEVRPAQLRRKPECQECERQDRLTLATQVDHIIPLEQGGAAFEPDNLQSLCKRCHDAKTAVENRERMKQLNR
ncbi:HNH endonuclease signature motif containing protein [Dyadobacter sandarakinus]|uniref:Putative HNH nuclease YajD n=1 Tax=Dyadobacter sandarakinus TaxID=2747268 RepID=A0ABX7I0X5_9BACT|nr:HNH endonuclease [Dyadobacter sandarakinus]